MFDLPILQSKHHFNSLQVVYKGIKFAFDAFILILHVLLRFVVAKFIHIAQKICIIVFLCSNWFPQPRKQLDQITSTGLVKVTVSS